MLSPTQKDYWWYSPANHHFYMFVDVTFEYTPFFNSLIYSEFVY